jgi:hypothetical protein
MISSIMTPNEATVHLIEKIKDDPQYKKAISDYLGPLTDYPCPYDLCMGMCEVWADLVSPFSQWLDHIGPYQMDHCIAVIDGRYYDALDPQGVECIDQLTIKTYTRKQWIEYNLP